MVLFESEDDRKTVLKDVFLENQQLKDFLARQQDKNQIMQRILQLISEQKKRFVLPENCNINAPFPLIYSEYARKLIDQNAMDFDDILFFAYRILTENPSVVRVYNSLYRYICIDEAQDLNFAQYQVIKALCGDSFNNVMMVGDANQSIYGFNGSDSDFMTKFFVSDFSPVIYKLNDNYRSAKRIVEFANHLEHYSGLSATTFLNCINSSSVQYARGSASLHPRCFGRFLKILRVNFEKAVSQFKEHCAYNIHTDWFCANLSFVTI